MFTQFNLGVAEPLMSAPEGETNADNAVESPGRAASVWDRWLAWWNSGSGPEGNQPDRLPGDADGDPPFGGAGGMSAADVVLAGAFVAGLVWLVRR